MAHKITAEHLISFAQAIDIPLIYIMKLDTFKCFNSDVVFGLVVNFEFERLTKEEGLNFSQAYAEITRHFNCSISSIVKARKLYGTYESIKK